MKAIILILILSSCRKDPVLPNIMVCNDTIPKLPCIANYNDYTTDSFDFAIKELLPHSPIFQTYVSVNEYAYSVPVFNPNSPYEIIYTRRYENDNDLDSEIWKFSFCTGKAIKITDDFYYGLDWGSNGWILYTGTGHRIHKIKDNGDSLTILSTQEGFNRAGKWNPSGTLYWNKRNQTQIENINGNIIKTVIYKPLFWLSDSTFLTQSTGFALYSYNINNEALIQLNSNWTNSTAAKIFDATNNYLYVADPNGTMEYDYLLKYDLNGSNQLDTVKKMYTSYMYSSGDIANDKMIITLVRKDWKDSLQDIVSVRMNLLMMNLDGTDERLVELP